MSESQDNLAPIIPSLAQFGDQAVHDATGNVPRETGPKFTSGLQDDLIMSNMKHADDFIGVQGDEIIAEAVAAAPTAAAAPISLGTKRPALREAPGPDPIRQHIENSHDESFYNLNSLSAHRARLIALLTYIHKYSGDMESRLDARIAKLESSQQIVQNNEIAVITINPLSGTIHENNMLGHCSQGTDQIRTTAANTNYQNNNDGSDNDTADAVESLREMQFSQMEIRYATMETHFKTQLEFSRTQNQESQRSVVCLQAIAGAALDQAKKCQEELTAVKAQMRSAHMALLQEIATIVHNLKYEIDGLKDNHEVLAAHALVANRSAPPEISSTSEERQQSVEIEVKN